MLVCCYLVVVVVVVWSMCGAYRDPQIHAGKPARTCVSAPVAHLPQVHLPAHHCPLNHCLQISNLSTFRKDVSETCLKDESMGQFQFNLSTQPPLSHFVGRTPRSPGSLHNLFSQPNPFSPAHKPLAALPSPFNLHISYHRQDASGSRAASSCLEPEEDDVAATHVIRPSVAKEIPPRPLQGQ